ncbi:hypothetical protein RB213_006987 [Colletotrichum asianum]
MASQTPVQGSNNPDTASVPKVNPQQTQAQAGARLDMFLSDQTLNSFHNRHAVSGNDADRRDDKVTAAIGHVDRLFAGHHADGGVESRPVCSDKSLRGVGAKFSD